MDTLVRNSIVIFAVCLSAAAWPQQTDRRPGDHPAVIVQRLHAQQGYDYASKFYPHPAWLYLRAEAPRAMMEHPAVTVFERHRHDASARLTTTPLELAGR
jgi:hypothetical protein